MIYNQAIIKPMPSYRIAAINLSEIIFSKINVNNSATGVASFFVRVIAIKSQEHHRVIKWVSNKVGIDQTQVW